MTTAHRSPSVLRLPVLPAWLADRRVPVGRASTGQVLFRLGVLITLFWVGVVLMAPWIAPHHPLKGNAALAKGSPSSVHLFGLDKYGRDVFSRVVYGSRYDLCIAVTVVGCALVVGTLIGSLSGFLDVHFTSPVPVSHHVPVGATGRSPCL